MRSLPFQCTAECLVNSFKDNRQSEQFLQEGPATIYIWNEINSPKPKNILVPHLTTPRKHTHWLVYKEQVSQKGFPLTYISEFYRIG